MPVQETNPKRHAAALALLLVILSCFPALSSGQDKPETDWVIVTPKVVEHGKRTVLEGPPVGPLYIPKWTKVIQPRFTVDKDAPLWRWAQLHVEGEYGVNSKHETIYVSSRTMCERHARTTWGNNSIIGGESNTETAQEAKAVWHYAKCMRSDDPRLKPPSIACESQCKPPGAFWPGDQILWWCNRCPH